jgi:hypothetical protein
MLMLDLDSLACNAPLLGRLGYGAKSFFGMLLHAHFVLIWRVLNHLRVGRESVKRRQDRERDDSGANLLGKAMPCWAAFPASSDPSVGIRILVYTRRSLSTAFGIV